MAWSKLRNHHEIPAFLLVKSWTAVCLLHFIKAFKEGETLLLVMAGGLSQSQKMSLLSPPRWVYSPKSWPWYMESGILFSGLLLWTHLVGCLFILLTVSFDVQKLLVLCSLGCFCLLPLILVSDPTKLTAQVFFQFYPFSSFTHCKLIVCVVWHRGPVSFFWMWTPLSQGPFLDSPSSTPSYTFPRWWSLGGLFYDHWHPQDPSACLLGCVGPPLSISLASRTPESSLGPPPCTFPALHLHPQWMLWTLHLHSPPFIPGALSSPHTCVSWPLPSWSLLCPDSSSLPPSAAPRLVPSQNPGPVSAWPPLLPLPSELPPGRSLSSLRPACHLGTESSSLL